MLMFIRSGTAFLVSIVVLTAVVSGPAIAQVPVNPLSMICDTQADRCMELGRSQFERYQLQKLVEIREKSGSYRLPSIPITRLHPQRSEYSVLLIHGLNDSPFYMGDLADLLYEHGFNVVTILLPGHGTDTREIRHITAEQWRDEVDLGLQIASLVGTKLIVGGFSLGGSLAIDAALRYSGIHALLLFAPAIRLPYFDSLYSLSCLPALRDLSINSKMPVNPVKYKYRNMNGICQVYRLLNNQLDRNKPEKPAATDHRLLHESAAQVRVPTFGIMSYADERVSTTAILEFFSELKAPALLTTFGSVPDEDRPPSLANGADIVHISDQNLPHSYLVLRINQYNGQANPYFDQVAQKLLDFLTKYL